MEVKHDFESAGGKEFHYIPCLNESPTWIAAWPKSPNST